MTDVKYKNAMAEVIEYLKGIRQEDIDKIPKKFMDFLEENASKDYECNINYYKPLKEQKLLEETRGIISLICLNYWCETSKQKEEFINKLNENEKIYQQEIKRKYNSEKLFKNEKQTVEIKEEKKEIVEYKKSWVKNLFDKIRIFFGIRKD